jgi:hypothetical protein
VTFDVLVLLFPVVLAIHNFEECIQYQQFSEAYQWRFPESLRARAVIVGAATALTLAATGIFVAVLIWRTPLLFTFAKVSICALLLNAVGHCLLSLRRGKWLPGTRSAAILVLPYGVFAVIVMRTMVGDSTLNLLRYALLGALTIPLAAAVFLPVGLAISKLHAAIAAR